MSEGLVRRIEHAQFGSVHLGQGYDMSEVDDLLDRVRDAVLAGKPVRPLLDSRPTIVSMRTSYRVEDVDALLASILDELDEAASAGSAPSPPRPAPPVSVVQEQKSFWQRLFGRE